LLHPSDEELNDTRRDRVKRVSLVNTPTFTWAYTRTFKERGKREIRNSVDNAFDCIAMGWDDFYLNKNRKWVTKNIGSRNNNQEKLKMRHWVNPNC
jgi:hypothetical protein